MLHLDTECYMQIGRHQCFEVVVVHKIASVEDDPLETDIHSVSSRVDAIDCHEVLPGPCVWLAPILM